MVQNKVLLREVLHGLRYKGTSSFNKSECIDHDVIHTAEWSFAFKRWNGCSFHSLYRFFFQYQTKYFWERSSHAFPPNYDIEWKWTLKNFLLLCNLLKFLDNITHSLLNFRINIPIWVKINACIISIYVNLILRTLYKLWFFFFFFGIVLTNIVFLEHLCIFILTCIRLLSSLVILTWRFYRRVQSKPQSVE